MLSPSNEEGDTPLLHGRLLTRGSAYAEINFLIQLF